MRCTRKTPQRGARVNVEGFVNTVEQARQDGCDTVVYASTSSIYRDGTQTRDFTHVSDIVRGAILTAEHELEGVYNVGTGDRYSFNTVVAMLNDELGATVEPEYVENPIPDSVYVHDTCADATRLREATGWEPEIDFEEGIRRVCAQYE